MVLCPLIKRCSQDARFRHFRADCDMESCPDRCMFRRQVCEPDVLLERYRGRPAGNVADLAPMDKHRVVISSDVFSEHLKAYESSLHALLLLLLQRFLANEFRFVKFYNQPE